MDELDATQLLLAWQKGDQNALSALTPMIYKELRRRAGSLMSQERSGHILQATALVNEAYLRLVNQKDTCWKSRAHFLGVAAHLMRKILIDHARAHGAAKRGGQMRKLSFDEAGDVVQQGEDFDWSDLEAALEELSQLSEEHSRVVELRFFGGLTIEETAEVLGVSSGTVKRRWDFARAWLRKRLKDGEGGDT